MLGDRVWQLGFQFIPKVLDEGAEIRALCRSVKFLYTSLRKRLYGPGFVCGGVVMLKQERVFFKVLEANYCLKYHCMLEY